MPSIEKSVLGLLELVDNGRLPEEHSRAALAGIQETFEERTRSWLRPKDECRSRENNRICVALKGVHTKAELQLAVSKLERVFAQPMHHLGRDIPLAVAAGFAVFNSANDDTSLPLQQANIALNRAKKTSSLYEIYSPQAAADAVAEKDMLSRLERAMDNGEFHLYYQPKVHAGYRNLMGAEALIRWHDPYAGLLLPDQFMDIAERSALIQPITWWCIKSAIATLSRWPTYLTVAVNISPALLVADDIVTVVNDALDIYSVDPSRLVLEVTERIMIDNHQRVVDQLTALRGIGVKVALDDFGTGFSSLAYFRDLPVDEIKIDQVFVRHMLSSDKDLAIVKAIIDLAHNFSMKVVAEGVENFDVADKLAVMNCDTLQGYAFDTPLSLQNFERQYGIA